MNIKNNALTIIVGGGVKTNEKYYEDGEIISIEKKFGFRHLEKLKEVAKILMIEDSLNNELEMMKIIAKNGHAVILNFGVNNKKQSASIMLPMQLTNNQITTFYSLKDELTKEYEKIESAAISESPLCYKGDLKIMEYEDKIKGRVQSNVESLYDEIKLHEERLNEMEKDNEQAKSK